MTRFHRGIIRRVTDVTLPVADEDRAEARPRFAAGTSIGRFRVVRELGAGGMGIVFEAYDPGRFTKSTPSTNSCSS
jgi:hypothetical protein